MKVADSENLKRQRNALLEEIRVVSEWYDQGVKKITSVPLFINAGAVVALATFFKSTDSTNIHINIKLAAVCFMLGVMFGMFALIFEFFASYFASRALKKYLNSIHKYSVKGQMEKLTRALNRRYKYYGADRCLKVSVATRLRILNFLLGVFLCFFGIFFVAQYIVNNIWPMLVFFGLLGYFLISLRCLYRKSN